MPFTLPCSVKNYRISTSSSTEELMTLGLIYAEAGDYASTILDREHLAVAKTCASKLEKLIPELIKRGAISTEEDLYKIPECNVGHKDISAMTIDELYRLYRQWPLRHKARAAEGGEHFSFYYEGHIVRELLSRKAADKGEQLKIDYCSLTYANECENMSSVLSMPLNVQDDKFFPDSKKIYTPSELLALIRLYTDYQDIEERELLVEFVDIALDTIANTELKTSVLELATEIAELDRKKIVNSPKWIQIFIEEAIETVSEQDKVLPLLTLSMIKEEPSLQNKAQLIVNQCYRMSLASPTIDRLYTAVMICDYVRDFNVRKIAMAWNELCASLQASEISIDTAQIIKLIEIADQLAPFAIISHEMRMNLMQTLEKRANRKDLEAQVWLKKLSLCDAAILTAV